MAMLPMRPEVRQLTWLRHKPGCELHGSEREDGPVQGVRCSCGVSAEKKAIIEARKERRRARRRAKAEQ